MAIRIFLQVQDVTVRGSRLVIRSPISEPELKTPVNKLPSVVRPQILEFCAGLSFPNRDPLFESPSSLVLGAQNLHPELPVALVDKYHIILAAPKGSSDERASKTHGHPSEAHLFAIIGRFARVRPVVRFPNFTALAVDEISRNSALPPPHQICIRHGPEHALIRVPKSHVQAVDVNNGKRNFPFVGDFANLRTAGFPESSQPACRPRAGEGLPRLVSEHTCSSTWPAASVAH